MTHFLANSIEDGTINMRSISLFKGFLLNSIYTKPRTFCPIFKSSTSMIREQLICDCGSHNLTEPKVVTIVCLRLETSVKSKMRNRQPTFTSS